MVQLGLKQMLFESPELICRHSAQMPGIHVQLQDTKRKQTMTKRKANDKSYRL